MITKINVFAIFNKVIIAKFKFQEKEQQTETNGRPTQDFLIPCPAVEGRPVTVLSQYSGMSQVSRARYFDTMFGCGGVAGHDAQSI